MKNYIDLGRDILQNSEFPSLKSRNGMRQCAIGKTLQFNNVHAALPILTTKKVSFKMIVSELVWFLSGATDLTFLHKHNNHIWDNNADKKGKVGPIYGYQWRHFGGYTDQIDRLIYNIKTDPYNTKHVVSAWNPNDLQDMALEPCHFAFQVHCFSPNSINLQVYQRSGDFCLGVPYNITSYATLLCLLGHLTGRTPGSLYFSFGNIHFYVEHINTFVNVQMPRIPHPILPVLRINPDLKNINLVTVDDFELINYNCHDPIFYPLIV